MVTKPLLRRYTNLAAALHILRTKTITLLDPSEWDDRNDRIAMRTYKERTNSQTLLALCFAESSETYHHWKVFADGPSGVCIHFRKDAFLKGLSGHPHVQHKKVEYRKALINAPLGSWRVSELPFLKRTPFGPEKEYRLLYTSAEKIPAYDIAIEMSWIDRVVLSPWMPDQLTDSVRQTLRSINGCEGLTVQKTTLISSTTWAKYVKNAVDVNG